MGHQWIAATCTTPKTCEICGATEGEPNGHTWEEATCEHPKRCVVCGITEGECLDHTWVEATCARAKHCSVCGYTVGETTPHTWSNPSYEGPKVCTVCGATEGLILTPGMEKRGYECTLKVGDSWDYVSLASEDDREVKGKATLIDYRKYNCDVEHDAREGYEWREVTVKFEMPTGCRVMWGYTDNYLGMEQYPIGNYITYPNGITENVRTTEAYKYEWKGSTCVSYGNFAIQVPENYKYLVFYVCSDDYEITHRIDPNIKFMDMN